MIREMLKVLEGIQENELKEPLNHRHADVLQEGVKSRQYQPLMQRTRCGKFDLILSKSNIRPSTYPISFAESLENRIQHYAKKRRIELHSKDSENVDNMITSLHTDDDGNE